jgi:signal transduction histidine kinase
MSAFAGLASRVRGMSLRLRLPASFAGVALLTMLVLGAILVPLLNDHYDRAESSYLTAGAAEAIQQLDAVDWTSVAASGETDLVEAAAALQSVKIAALSLQLRIEVFDPQGTLLIDSGPVNDIDPTGIVDSHDDDADDATGEGDGTGRGQGSGRLPSPVGSGLLAADEARGSRSDRSTTAELTAGGQTVAKIRLSEGPAYGAAVLRTTVVAWLLAGIGAVILAALAGWMISQRMTRPLLAITAASDSMARGDLGVRAKVDRSDEIGRLGTSFNAMAETTQKTVGALRRFVADAAHELGTPLTALQADLELAQQGSGEPGVQRLIRRALSQTDRIEHLSTDLLRLSRLERGPLSMPVEPLDLVPLARRLADDVASRAEQAGIDFNLDLPEDSLQIRGNADALRNAAGNLLDNALKFTPAGGTVVLGAKADGRVALMWVEDTGIGIPSGDLDGLFSRFHRGRNAAAYPGSGLGLAIVRATVELHGGTVSVESRTVQGQTASEATAGSEASGSRFELRLPLA